MSNQQLKDAHAAWMARNDVMIVALNLADKIVAAGWFNLDHSPDREDKAEVKRFYRECAGHEIKALRGDEIEQYKNKEWAA